MKSRLLNPPVIPESRHDVTIVVQGRLSPYALEFLPLYARFGNVILSCWETDDLALLANVDTAAIPVVLTTPPPAGCGYNYGNVLLQAITTHAGLAHVATPWALKTRCDEYYTDFGPFIAAMRGSPGKLITNNVFFRADKVYKFHPSDHVIGGRTDAMRETFRILRDRCLSGEPAPRGQPGWMPTEALITTSFLRHLGIEADPRRSREIMQEHIGLVRLSQMGRFLVACNNAGTAFTTEEELLRQDSIASMEEL